MEQKHLNTLKVLERECVFKLRGALFDRNEFTFARTRERSRCRELIARIRALRAVLAYFGPTNA